MAVGRCLQYMVPNLFARVKPIQAVGNNNVAMAEISSINTDISGVTDGEQSIDSVNLVPIGLHELRDYIRLAYDGDEKMQKEYHILRGTLEEQVEYTFQQSVKDLHDYRHLICKIVYNRMGVKPVDVGYSVLIFDEVSVLHTFGININFRIERIKKLWLLAVSDMFNNDMYFITLRERNKRAIKFFRNNNFDIQYHQNEEENFYLLWPQQ